MDMDIVPVLPPLLLPPPPLPQPAKSDRSDNMTTNQSFFDFIVFLLVTIFALLKLLIVKRVAKNSLNILAALPH
jgi:hypothetical protein